MKKRFILIPLLAVAFSITACSNTSTSTKNKSSEDSTSESVSSNTKATLILEDGTYITEGSYKATETDQSVVEAYNNISATLENVTLTKSAGEASSANDSSFKGVNSAVRAYDGATLTIKNSTIEASAKNATGVFAYDTGTIYISDSTINVTGGGAGGVQVAGGGTLYGTNLCVTTESKAAIRSDKGGGLLVIDGGTYTSNGSNGCPAIYSTADIRVKNATCVANNSRAVIIEGDNYVTLENTDLTGNDQSTKSGSVKANVLLYQSTSGDADEGTSIFTMTGGSIESKSGAMFYTTNTKSTINLNDADLILSSENNLLIVSEGRWGSDGSNGGDCVLNATNQELTGLITVDSISSLDINLVSSNYTGAISNEGTTNLVIDSNSTFTLTADSYVTSFKGDASNIIANGYSLYVNGVKLTGTN